MSGFYRQLMRLAPVILIFGALLIYLSDVITILAEGRQLNGLGEDLLPAIVKLRMLFLTFVKPMEVPLFIFLGGAILWRLDGWLSSSGAAE